MVLKEWLEKNSKEGADISEVLKLAEAQEIKIESREKAAELIEKNKYLTAELDAETTKRVDNALEKFKEGKLPELIKSEREKIQKELNPGETAEQKRIRELSEKLDTMQKKEELENKKTALRLKAKELKYDPLKAERYAGFGDDAEKLLENDAKEYETVINNRVNEIIKQKYGGKPPEAANQDTSKQMNRQSFDGMPSNSQMQFVKEGGKIID